MTRFRAAERTGRTSAAFTVCVALALAGDVAAGVIPAATNEELAAAVAAAAMGDTVLVAGGTYQVGGLALADGVVLLADGEPGCVTIETDGSVPVFTLTGNGPGTVIMGLRFSGAAAGAGVDRGGALRLIDADALVSRCEFVGLGAGYGGAVHCAGGAPVFVSCRFTGNVAVAAGGAMAVTGGARPSLVACLLTGNVAGVSGSALNVASGSGAALFRCTIEADPAAVPPLHGWDGGVIELDASIVAGGSWAGDATAAPAARLSDFWLDGADPFVGLLAPLGESGDNFAADPLFCSRGPHPGSYELDAVSPCAPVPGVRDAIGAFGVGCAVSSVPGDDGGAQLPRVAAIGGNHPNPFNPATTIRFALPAAGRASLVVYDLRGRLVRHLVDGDLAAGPHRIGWDGRADDGRAVAAGVYFARLRAFGQTDTHRMSLIK